MTGMFQTLFSMMPSGVSIATDISCREIIHNHYTAKLLRIKPWENLTFSTDALLGLKVFRAGIELTASDMPIQKSILYNKKVVSDELVFVWPDGVRKVALWNSAPIYDDLGVLCGAVATCEEITERKKIEDELATQHGEVLQQEIVKRRHAEELFYKAFHLSPDIMTITEPETGLFIDVNEQFAALYGCAREEIIGKSLYHLKMFDEDELRELKIILADKGRIKNYELNCTTRTGEILKTLTSVETIEISSQRYFLSSANDITEIKKIEEDLRKSNEFITDILESMSDSFFALDNDWRYTYTNREHEISHGHKREEVLGRSIWEIHDYEVGSIFYDEYKKAMTEQIPRHFQSYGLRRHKNACLDVHVYPSKDGLSVYYRDVSESKKYEQELARLERLNLIGQMSAGISHEIRNPMTTVRGFLQLLTCKTEYAKEKDIFELMISELDRCNEIMTEYLSLAKNKVINLQKLDLNVLIDKINPLIAANGIMENKYIEYRRGPIPELMLDESEIRQLLLNLVRNGLEAMPPEAILTISTYMENDCAVLAVQDSGSGIPAEILAKLGTPFFTTKETGTGLGLAICYSIVHRHQATIDVKSDDHGTTFVIRFPIEIAS